MQDSQGFLEERGNFNFQKFYQQALKEDQVEWRKVKTDCGDLSGLKTGRKGLVTVLEDKRKLAVCDVEYMEEEEEG